MNTSTPKNVQQDWFSAQKDREIPPSKLTNLVEFIARRAAERDFESWAALQNKEGKD